MRAVDISRVDLNLLVVLDALLDRGSVTGAAAALGLTQPTVSHALARLAEGALDLAVLPAQGEGPGLVQRVVGTVRWCVLARRRHPALRRGRLDLDAWLGSPHVVVRTGEGAGAVGRELARRGLARRVAFAAPSSLAAAHAVAHTDWFFAAPRELVRRLAGDLGLAVLDPPVALPAVRVGLVWHERMHADPGHRWLRELFAGFAARALARGRPADQPRAPKTRRSTSSTRRPASTGLTSTQ
jgi:DNA-binding transcriptional LysR family regulator